MLVFELLVQESYQWRVKCAVEMNFSDMCWKIDGKCELERKKFKKRLKVSRDKFGSSI